MPIKPENRDRYPADWKARRARVLERAGHACERCRAPDRTWVVRVAGTPAWAPAVNFRGDVPTKEDAAEAAMTADHDGLWRGARGEALRLSELPTFTSYDACRLTRVVLTTAHLDNDLVDHGDANLAALCQRCHLTHDATQRRIAAAHAAHATAPPDPVAAARAFVAERAEPAPATPAPDPRQQELFA